MRGLGERRRKKETALSFAIGKFKFSATRAPEIGDDS